MKIAWPKIKEVAIAALKKKGLNGIYTKRLNFELDQIESQGAQRYWEDLLESGRKYDKNVNQLLLPWLLGRFTGDANIDPIANRDGPLMLSAKYDDVQAILKKTGKLPIDIRQDDDKPDIDIDCLPEARNKIKDYAAERYGKNNVASVGTWQAYLLKQAIADAYTAYGLDELEGGSQHGAGIRNRAIELTKLLPDDVNEMREGGYGACKGRVREDGKPDRECGFKHKELKCPQCGSGDADTPTIAMIMRDFPEIEKFIKENPEQHQRVMDTAIRLVGRLKHAGKHAGGIIISDRDLFGNVPMQLDRKTQQWVSIWTEGRSTQLSKFGYLKWDMLGLKNLSYIKTCCEMIRENHGISFGDQLQGWDESDQIDEIAGYYWKDGIKTAIPLNDKAALGLANDGLTDSIFQFDTDLAKRTLSNGVKSFHDLLIFNAMGHPGPMQSIPDYVKNRDDSSNSWAKGEHEDIVEILKPTSGVIVFQEQLTSIWQRVAGFTGPESQDARKAVAKKWKDKLKPVREHWITGASKKIGEPKAHVYWDKMETFGRYAFNLSHAICYCLWAYRCLWLKAHYAEEWWASVMGTCDQKALERYMSAARSEGVKFGEIDIAKLTLFPTAHSGPNTDKSIALGLTSLKKIGEAAAAIFVDEVGGNVYTDIDDFIAKKGKSKILFERLIKLGAFTKLHPNKRAAWMWYLHEHGTGSVEEFEFENIDDQAKKEVAEDKAKQLHSKPKLKNFSHPIKILKNFHIRYFLAKANWTEETILAERERQTAEFKKQFPKRKVIPTKILNWRPVVKITHKDIESLYSDDYDLKKILKFEKDFLGYHWHSPIDLYRTSGNHTIDKSKDNECLECVIVSAVSAKTKNGSDMLRIIASDGRKTCLILVWEQDIKNQNKKWLTPDQGVRIRVDYDPDRNSFVLKRGTVIEPLWTKDAWQKLQADTE
jgi:DNA polymerase III alpha subunit